MMSVGYQFCTSIHTCSIVFVFLSQSAQHSKSSMDHPKSLLCDAVITVRLVFARTEYDKVFQIGYFYMNSFNIPLNLLNQ